MNRNVRQVEGFGGWLALVALGVIAAPLIQLGSIVEVAEGYNSFSAMYGDIPLGVNSVLFVEMFGGGFFLAWACFNIYFFFKKKTAFKNSYVGFLCLNFLFVIVDIVAAEIVADLSVTSAELFDTTRFFIFVLIWSAYIYRSERVSNTFVHENKSSRDWKFQASAMVLVGALSLLGVAIFSKAVPSPAITEDMLQAEALGVTESMINDDVRLDGASASGMTFTFNYTLMDGTADEWDVNEVAAHFRPFALEGTCTDLGGWLKAGVTVQYRYSGNDGQPVATLEFKDSDCSDLVQQNSEETTTITPRDIAANAKASFVSIEGQIGGESVSYGSGFIVRSDGVVVTNLHVLQDVEAIKITLPNGEIYDRVFVLDVDEVRDLALLQIPATGLSALRIGDDRAVEVGDTVYALGNPLGLSQTFTDGILSARRITDGVERLQISAPISQGSSGGPVLNSSGEVIGVATAFMEDGQNLNMAMPSHYVSGMLAIINDPKPFEELAMIGALSSSPTVAERSADYAELFASFPAELLESLDELEPWQKQTAVRGFVTGYLLEGAGWEEVDTNSEGMLAPDKFDSFTITLEAGEYSAFSVCDNDCTDLDLGVVVGIEEPLTDKDLDANPVVTFNVVKRTNVTIYTAMRSCATEHCMFWTQLYRNQQ